MESIGTTNNKLIKENFPSSIQSLSDELLTQIVARVASASFKDYINVKISCKLFYKVGNERRVYQNATLAEFPIVPIWQKQKQESYMNKFNCFMELCRECGNTEALYRKGVMDFFKEDTSENALELVKGAAEGGHIGATYAMGIIMIFMGGDFEDKGISLIGNMKRTKTSRKITRDCRKKLIQILRYNWVINPTVFAKTPSRCTIRHKPIPKNFWSSDDEDDNITDFHCDVCSCNVEIAHIIDVLPRW